MILILTNIKANYEYKLVCVIDKFSKCFKSNLGEDAVYSLINSMSSKSKYCSDVIKNILTKNF